MKNKVMQIMYFPLSDLVLKYKTDNIDLDLNSFKGNVELCTCVTMSRYGFLEI